VHDVAATTRVIVVDDEELARRGIRALLDRDPAVQVVGEATNGIDAVKLIAAVDADIMFLDIQMPGLDGFEVLEAIDMDRAPLVIFVTAHDEYAIQAFEQSALDYLLKPIDPQRLIQALDRAKSRLREKADGRIGRDLARLIASRAGDLENAAQGDRVAFRDGGRLILLDRDEIEWIGAEDDYVRVHTARKNYLIRETLSSVEQRVDPTRFVRIHRSTLVNVNVVREVVQAANHDAVVVLRSGEKLRASRRYREIIAERFSV
jgi:two-component system LytT family response regulator